MFRNSLIERVLDVLDNGEESQYLNSFIQYLQDTHYSMLYQMLVIDLLIPELHIDSPIWGDINWKVDKENMLAYLCGKFQPDRDGESLKEWMKLCSRITLTGNLRQSESFFNSLQQLQQLHFAAIAGQTLDLLFKEEEA